MKKKTCENKTKDIAEDMKIYEKIINDTFNEPSFDECNKEEERI